MRRYSILAIVIGVCILSNAHGSGSNPFMVPPEDLPDGPGMRGGSITLDLPSEPETFNPIIAQGGSDRAVTALMHATLFEFPRVPALVKSYDQSVDGRILTLFLREGVQFSDGTLMTCADVEFTFDDVLFNEDVISPKEAWRIAGDFPKVECIDEYTVQITTPTRFNGLIEFLLTSLPILPRHLLADKVHKLNPDPEVPPGNFNTVWGVNTPPDQIAGLGPFRLSEYIIGQQVVLERNPYYWKVDPEGTQLPYLDQIILPIVRDDSVRVLRYLNSQTDMLRPRPEDVSAIAREGLGVMVLPAGTTNSNVFIFNQDVEDLALRAVFREVRFRQAMSHAADRESMIDLSLNGYGEPRCGPGIAPIFWFSVQSHPEFCPFPFDLEKAAQILNELGLVDTNNNGIRNITDEFLTSQGVPLEGLPEEDKRELGFEILTDGGSKPLAGDAEIYAEALRNLGLNVRVNPVPLDTLLVSLHGGKYEVARVNFISNGDPNALADIYTSKGRLHFWKPSDADGENVAEWQERVDEILMEQKTAEAERRWDLMKEFQEIVAENVPMIFLYNVNNIQAYKDHVGNFKGLEGKATIRHSELLFLK